MTQKGCKMKKAVDRLAQTLDIPLRRASTTKNRYNWDGEILFGKSISNTIHDIAHWMVASPARRRIPEFGLGPSPDRESSRAPRYLNGVSSRREEMRASLLGILLERQIGSPWKKTWKTHNWGQGVGFAPYLLWLLRNGFVNLDLSVNLLTRPIKTKVATARIAKVSEMFLSEIHPRKGF